MKRWLVAVAVSLWAPGSALAGEGVVEINQARVNAGSITPGDAPGFPATISVSGSYQLTGDLRSSSKGVTLIDVTVPRVTLDLNGFTVGACLSAGACGTGSETMIRAFGDDVVVRNGRLLNAGGICLHTGRRSRVENLQVSGCGTSGISTSLYSRVSNVQVEAVGTTGISSGQGTVITDSIVTNSLEGIRAVLAALVSTTYLAGNVTALVTGASSPGARAGYRGCVLVNNGTDVETQTIGTVWVNMGGNICGTNTTCP